MCMNCVHVCSICVGKESVIEYCILEPGVAVGNKCMVSNLHLPAGAQVPEGSFLHSVPVLVDNTIMYTTFAFG